MAKLMNRTLFVKLTGQDIRMQLAIRAGSLFLRRNLSHEVLRNGSGGVFLDDVRTMPADYWLTAIRLPVLVISPMETVGAKMAAGFQFWRTRYCF